MGPFRRIFILLALLASVALTLPPSAQSSAAPSNASPDAGIVITDFGSDEEGGGGVAIQADGRIVQAGTTGGKLLVIRYTTTGAFDPTFGDGGKVVTDFGQGMQAGGQGVALQPDGKIVVAAWLMTKDPLEQGEDTFDIALIRYTTAGALDPTFAASGKLIIDLGSDHEGGGSVAIQSDGRIVQAGGTGGKILVIRYTATGAFDPTFGDGGKVITGFGQGTQAAAATLAIQPDGKIVVAGETSPIEPVEGGSAQPDIALARYTTEGALDSSFGRGGKVLTSFGTAADEAEAVAVQPHGKILLAGYSRNDEFIVLRYATTGLLDRSFGDDGRVITRFAPAQSESSAGASAMAVQSDGRIVVAGFDENGLDGDRDVALARYRRTGSLDREFGHKGKVTTDFGSHGDYSTDVAIQRDGMIVVSGTTSETDDQDNEIGDVAIARYTATGSLDPTFGVEEVSPSPLSSPTAGPGGGRSAEPATKDRTTLYGALVGFPLLVLVSVLVLLFIRRRKTGSTYR